MACDAAGARPPAPWDWDVPIPDLLCHQQALRKVPRSPLPSLFPSTGASSRGRPIALQANQLAAGAPRGAEEEAPLRKRQKQARLKGRRRSRPSIGLSLSDALRCADAVLKVARNILHPFSYPSSGSHWRGRGRLGQSDDCVAERRPHLFRQRPSPTPASTKHLAQTETRRLSSPPFLLIVVQLTLLRSTSVTPHPTAATSRGTRAVLSGWRDQIRTGPAPHSPHTRNNKRT